MLKEFIVYVTVLRSAVTLRFCDHDFCNFGSRNLGFYNLGSLNFGFHNLSSRFHDLTELIREKSSSCELLSEP